MGGVDHLAGEDDLITDLHPDLAKAGDGEAARPRPGGEIHIPRHQPRKAERLEQPRHRQIFAIRDEMRLVVAPVDSRCGVDREYRIGRGGDVAGAVELQRGAAGEQHVTRAEQRCHTAPDLLRVLLIAVDIGRIAVLDQIAHHALRPQHQPRRGPRDARQRGELAQQQFAVALAALVLRDIGLDDDEARGVRRLPGGFAISQRLRRQQRDQREARSG